VRACVRDKGLTLCSDCPDFRAPRDFRECVKVNNWIARAIAFFTGSNRPAALAMLRDQGREAYLAARGRPQSR